MSEVTPNAAAIATKGDHCFADMFCSPVVKPCRSIGLNCGRGSVRQSRPAAILAPLRFAARLNALRTARIVPQGENEWCLVVFSRIYCAKQVNFCVLSTRRLLSLDDSRPRQLA